MKVCRWLAPAGGVLSVAVLLLGCGEPVAQPGGPAADAASEVSASNAEAPAAEEADTDAPPADGPASADEKSSKLMLGSDELTAGIPGKGPPATSRR